MPNIDDTGFHRCGIRVAEAMADTAVQATLKKELLLFRCR